MRKTASRALAALFLVAVICIGLFVYIIRLARDGDEWTSFPVNSHAYRSGVLVKGTITDRNEEIISAVDEDGQRVFSDSESARRGLLHIVGDREGNIGTGILNLYSKQLMGYDFINGTYSLRGNGNTVHLTVDTELSAYAYEQIKYRKGAVAVYNYKTGELLCLVSTPGFDPDNVPVIEDGDERYDGAYMNRCLSSAFTPGSIFKIVTAAAAIETVDGIENMTFECDGSCEIDGETITCSGYHGTVGFYDALAQSCNCAFAEISQLVGANTLAKYAEKYGLTESHSISGITTAAGSFTKAPDGSTDLSWSGIGQYDDLVNPVAAMRLMGAIACGGIVREPYLVDRITTSGGLPTALVGKGGSSRIMTKETADKLKDMLSYNYTSNYCYTLGYIDGMCAKSGTAEVGEGEEPHSWYVGFIDDPECPLAFAVIVENGGWGLTTSGTIAANVIAKARESGCCS